MSQGTRPYETVCGMEQILVIVLLVKDSNVCSTSAEKDVPMTLIGRAHMRVKIQALTTYIFPN